MTTTRERVRDTVLGSERRIGLWIVPLFLIVALLGATLAGSVAALYYGQQVRRLESTTADARAEVEQARQEITTTASEAQETIDAQMRRAREELAQEPPVESPRDAGVFAVSADHAAGEVRVGSAFVIASKENETHLATTYDLVQSGDQAVEAVRVFLEGGPVPAVVHNYDPERDVATLRLDAGPLPVPDWRPGDDPIRPGDPVYLVGLAGPGAPSVLEGRVAGASNEALVPSIPVNSFLAGAPLVDASGRVVAMASVSYAPYGPVDGDPLYAVRLSGFCVRAVDCTLVDLGEGRAEEGGGEDGPAEGPRAKEPTPPPEPSFEQRFEQEFQERLRQQRSSRPTEQPPTEQPSTEQPPTEQSPTEPQPPEENGGDGSGQAEDGADGSGLIDGQE